MISAFMMYLSWFQDAIEWLKEIYASLVAYGNQFILIYSGWGAFAWLFAAWVESVFPILLLSLITVINIQAAQIWLGPVFGWIVGFLLSWIGTTIGAITMFSFWRYLANKWQGFRLRMAKKQGKDYEKVAQQSSKGVVGLFSISSIPLLPSSIINFTYAFTKMRTKVFIKTTIIAKFFMMLFMSIFAGFFDWLFADLFRAGLTSLIILAFALLLNKNEDRLVAWVKTIAYRSKSLRRMDEQNEKEMQAAFVKEKLSSKVEQTDEKSEENQEGNK